VELLMAPPRTACWRTARACSAASSSGPNWAARQLFCPPRPAGWHGKPSFRCERARLQSNGPGAWPGEAARLPPEITLSLVEAREADPPAGATPAHWRLLTTHMVATLADAKQISHFYRQRWIIEQLFRTMKTKGFDIEAVRVIDGGPFEKLTAATLIAAIQVLQLVRERDGAANRLLEDVFDPQGSAGSRSRLRHPGGTNRETKKPAPQHKPGLRSLGLRTSRRMDRVLRQARPCRNAPRPAALQGHTSWMEPGATGVTDV
jgi:hypothetical protein